MNCKNFGKKAWEKFSKFNGIKNFIAPMMSYQKMANARILEKAEGRVLPLLELPELGLDNILERLSPADLLNMAFVCRSLRERCQEDHLWIKHMNRKWRKIIGKKAQLEWLVLTEAIENDPSLKLGAGKTCHGLVPCAWNLSWIMKDGKAAKITLSNSASYMSWFFLLESGYFWFSAQVYGRQTCSDAILRYDRLTNTFRSRRPSPELSHAPYVEQRSIRWERVRASPTDNLSHHPHVSDCLDDLRPGDHVEIQWRHSNDGSPYDWWYAVVGHLYSCDGNMQCRCSYSDNLAIEFKQYPAQSLWSKVIMPKKDQDRIQNKNSTGGFYGGIRKLYKEDEISMWTMRLNNLL